MVKPVKKGKKDTDYLREQVYGSTGGEVPYKERSMTSVFLAMVVILGLAFTVSFLPEEGLFAPGSEMAAEEETAVQSANLLENKMFTAIRNYGSKGTTEEKRPSEAMTKAGLQALNQEIKIGLVIGREDGKAGPGLFNNLGRKIKGAWSRTLVAKNASPRDGQRKLGSGA